MTKIKTVIKFGMDNGKMAINPFQGLKYGKGTPSIDYLTEEEIKRGIKEAKPLAEYDNLSESAYLRAKEDYLMGINFSRLLSLRYGDDMASFFPEYKLLLVTIGNNKLRERLYQEAATIGYTFPNIIHPTAYISPHAHIGSGCVILNNAVVQNNAQCGDGCILNPGVELHHDSTIGSYCLIYTNSVVRSLTTVGDRVWIGASSTVTTSAVVEDDTIIEDGSVFKVGV